MAKKNTNSVTISNSRMEDFIWMSYRYCIGRKTIAACTHADTIAELISKNPKMLSEERKAFMAKDIRREINNQLNFKKSLCIDNERDGQDIYSSLLYELNSFDDHKKKVFYFDAKTMSIYDTKVHPDLYEFETPDYDYTDLIPWVKLANWLDESTHRVLTVEFNGEKQEIECYPYPRQDRNNDGAVTYREAWCSIAEPAIGITRYITEEYIIEIESRE